MAPADAFLAVPKASLRAGKIASLAQDHPSLAFNDRDAQSCSMMSSQKRVPSRMNPNHMTRLTATKDHSNIEYYSQSGIFLNMKLDVEGLVSP